MEEVTIPVQGIRLYGRLNLNPGSEKGVVITHPHPLYGGNMDNPVVLEMARAFYAAGFSTLRFNFRGTGRSSGMFDDGKGEQEDVRAALSLLKEKGLSTTWLAGYSFGSWVNAKVVSAGADIQDHIMVSPPAAFISFDMDTLPDTGLIVTGMEDDIAPPDRIQSLINRWGINPEFTVLEPGDHFYSGNLPRLGKVLTTYLS